MVERNYDMNTENYNGNASDDSGGFEGTGYDNRNGKWQARANHNPSYTAGKSYNAKNLFKVMQKREAKFERDYQKALEQKHMAHLDSENKKWAAVDKKDAR